MLARPIESLVQTFGTGLLGPSGAAAALRGSAAELAAAAQTSAAEAGALGGAWNGPASEAAQSTTRSLGDRTTRLAGRGDAMGKSVDRAADVIRAGAIKIEKILADFIAQAIAAGPTLHTPAGQIMLVGSAVEHLGKALQVVAEVRAKLDAEAAQLDQSSTDSTGPGGSGHTAQSSGNPVGDIAKTFSQAVGSGGGPLSTLPAAMGSPGEFGMAADPGPGGTAVHLPDGSTAMAPNERAAAAVRAALSQQGVPYVWGGTTPGQGLDCSGLTQWAYREAGIELPRLAQEQGVGMPVPAGELLPGDLAVWSGHVAMVAGNGLFIEAGDPVQLSPIRTTNLDQNFYGFFRPSA